MFWDGNSERDWIKKKKKLLERQQHKKNRVEFWGERRKEGRKMLRLLRLNQKERTLLKNCDGG